MKLVEVMYKLGTTFNDEFEQFKNHVVAVEIRAQAESYPNETYEICLNTVRYNVEQELERKCAEIKRAARFAHFEPEYVRQLQHWNDAAHKALSDYKRTRGKNRRAYFLALSRYRAAWADYYRIALENLRNGKLDLPPKPIQEPPITPIVRGAKSDELPF